jgi:hypothetical protein
MGTLLHTAPERSQVGHAEGMLDASVDEPAAAGTHAGHAGAECHTRTTHVRAHIILAAK